ncbi:AlpA family phage regulatory protein [Paenirhodobacter sp. CAU 1674]|uniref:helix-turn-helix transcriptional regulator n=1 Tax=Paenirhodobacter sp. CAU 1674 TaxID=3032596 RepID=UPI0023DCDC23|nr:AlpA family phage regulatory protein [Paenirhodobacter sp. CAU 1674]MDF2141722.1 AlpA family phage regulatory protein [Paenirhodobacter sp. CAU 1674]
MNAVDPEQFFLNVKQVATRYGVSTDTIWRWKNQGEFPRPVKVSNGCTRWRLADLIAHEATLQACFLTEFAFG